MMTVEIQNMTCDHCKRAVENALRDLPGVQSVQVDVKAGRAQVEGAPDPAQLLAALAEEGYPAQIR